MSDRSTIIERIKKLLALAADNPSVAEATAAALRAQKLMAEHDVRENELADDEEELVEVMSASYSGKAWRRWMAGVIADNFRCRTWACVGFNEVGKRVERQVFLGYDTDASAAKLTFEMLTNAGEDLAREAARRERLVAGTAKGVKNAFLYGYTIGVKQELEKQAQALMLVRPKEVEDEYQSRTRTFKRAASPKVDRRRQWYVSKGAESGRDAVRSRRLAGQAALDA